jgi:cysteine desulfurase/selenocysteine lyase
MLKSLINQREDFPCLDQTFSGKPLTYLDTAATAQKPRVVIEAMNHYYYQDNANIHRGIYALASRATDAYENARETTRKFINAKHIEEIVFIKGTTEGINLIANCFSKVNIYPGDEILISLLEHHSNLVPWVEVCKQYGATLKVIPLLPTGDIDFEAYKNLLSDKTKIVAITHISNVLGTILPIKEMITLAHQKNIPVLIDGAQGIVHGNVDVQDLDCDFYVFSGHKLYGPMGVGILYGKRDRLNALPPYQMGGSMISKVSFEEIKYAPIPTKFEAGTPPVAEAIGLATAILYIQEIGFSAIIAHEEKLGSLLIDGIKTLKKCQLVRHPKNHSTVYSIVFDDIHAHDIATILDSEGIAVRAGHHCAMPLLASLKVPATLRASLGIYNNEEDIGRLIDGLKKAKEIFQ